MVTITFPTRAEIPSPAERGGTSLPDAGAGGFGALFALMQAGPPADDPAPPPVGASVDQRPEPREAAERPDERDWASTEEQEPPPPPATAFAAAPAPPPPAPDGQGAPSAEPPAPSAEGIAAHPPPAVAAPFPQSPEEFAAAPAEDAPVVLAWADPVPARGPSAGTGVPAFWAARVAAEQQPPAPVSPQGAEAGQADRAAAAAPQVEVAAAAPSGPDAMTGAADTAGAVPAELPSATPGPASLPAAPAAVQIALPGPPVSSPGAPVLPPQLPAQIAAAIADRPERPLELRLSPVELGGLTVNLRNEGDILRVTLHADRPETLDLLRRNGDALLDELRQAGFAGASLSFADGGGARGRSDPEPQPQATPTVAGNGRDRTGPPSSLPASAPVPVAQGLDLRL